VRDLGPQVNGPSTPPWAANSALDVIEAHSRFFVAADDHRVEGLQKRAIQVSMMDPKTRDSSVTNGLVGAARKGITRLKRSPAELNSSGVGEDFEACLLCSGAEAGRCIWLPVFVSVVQANTR